MTEVVAALIWDGDRFLICQRPAHKARGLLWEFVGGKVEPGETKEDALIRECREELDITLSVGDVFMEVTHEYPDLTVHLTLFHARIAAGVPKKLEHVDLQWITPAEIVILGAGTLGEFAARAALGLGATVKIFDHSVERLRKLNEVLGQRVFTSVFHKPVLDKALASADVLIGAMRCFDNGENTVVSEAQVRLMKRGAVIVDMSIDHGGCIETAGPTTHEKPVYTYEGVIHYCVPNVLSRVARTASIAYSNVFLPMLQHIARQGGFTNAIRMDAGLREGVYLYNGILTKNVIADKLGLIARDINLLIAAL